MLQPSALLKRLQMQSKNPSSLILTQNHFPVFRRVFFLMVLFLMSVELATCGSMPPTAVIADPHYFGSHYIKLASMPLIQSSAFPNGPNKFVYPLGKVYSNIRKSNIVLASFQCDSTDYFGFKLDLLIATDPASKVDVTFEPRLNSLFSIIGVSVIVVTEPFDQVMHFVQFDLDVPNQYTSQTFTFPATYQFNKYIKSASEQLTGLSSFQIGLNVNIVLPDTIRALFGSSNAHFVGDNYNVQIVVIILDLTALSNIRQLNFLSKNYYLNYNTVTNNNFNISSTKYGPDYNKKCILGFPWFERINPSKPFYLFDLDPALGVVNYTENSINHQVDYLSFCFQDLECPSAYPYKHQNDHTDCWDCVGGFATSENKIQFCEVYDTAFEKMKYDSGSGFILSYCLKCTACDDQHYAENAICNQCDSNWPWCKTCDEKISCLTCFNTHALDASNNCAPCSSFPSISNCAECFDNSTCTKCKDGYYLLYNACLKCSDSIRYCQKCLSATECTDCGTQLIVSTDKASCICEKGRIVTGTCSSVPGCISSHMVGNQTKCFACNTTFHWVYKVHHSCMCRKGYKQVNQTLCQLVCGDGVWTEEQCDDNNTNNGDGCSSLCQKEQDFECQNVYGQKSICKYVPKIKSSVYSLSRKYSSGSMVLKLQFSPFHEIIRSNDWDNQIQVNSSKIRYQSHQFEDNQILVLTFAIVQSVEKQTFKWTLSYDQDKFKNTQTNQLQILMKGMNAPLTYESYYKHEKILEIISYVVGGVAVLIAIVSMIKAESNIAFEIVTTVMFVFYSRILSYHSNSAVLYTLSGLRIAAGFNEFFPNEHRDYIQYCVKNRFFIKSQLGIMSLFTLLLLAIILSLKIGFKIKSLFSLIFEKKIEIKDQMKQNKKHWIVFKMFSQAFTSYENIQKKYVIPITLICLFTVFCEFNGFQNAGSMYKAHFGPVETNLILLFFFIVLLYYLASGASIIGNLSSKLDTPQLKKRHKKKTLTLSSHQTTHDYADAYFMYLLFTSVLIFFTMDFTREIQNLQSVTEACFGLIIIYTIGILIFRPYDDKLNQFAIVSHQIVKMAFIAFLFLLQKNLLNQLYQLIGVYVTLSLLILLEVLSIFRIKETWIPWSDSKSEQQELKETMKLKKSIQQGKGKVKQQNKPVKKYIKDDTQNKFRHQNIKREEDKKLEENGDFLNGFQKSIPKMGMLQALKSAAKNQAFLGQSEIKASLFDKKAIQEQDDANDQSRPLNKKAASSSLISANGLQSFLDKGKPSNKPSSNQINDKQKLAKIKQALRQECKQVKFERQQKMRDQEYQLRTGMNAYEEELEKQYEYERWRLQNEEKANKEKYRKYK